MIVSFDVFSSLLSHISSMTSLVKFHHIAPKH